MKPLGALLAVDLDGTLVRHDGTIAERDLLACRLARDKGIGVVLATGRLPPDSLHIARRLGSELPLISGDGAIVTHLESGMAEISCLSRLEIQALRVAHERHALPHFALGPHCCYFDGGHEAWLGLLTGWCRGARQEHRKPGADADADVVLTLGVGSAQLVTACSEDIQRDFSRRVFTDVFSLGGSGYWALRCMRRGVSKAQAFQALVRRLGIAHSGTAAIGNGLNDLALLRCVTHSFAMADADEAVKRSAARVVNACGARGGGVAEALTYLLDLEARLPPAVAR